MHVKTSQEYWIMTKWMREKNYHLPLGPSHDGPGVLYIRLGSRFQLYSLKKLTNSRLIRIKTKDDQV